ncbi:RNase P modulator RnpM [Lactobacillaceae bacterium Melli_B4]
MRRRKIPMRKDIVTGEMAPKKELIRVVRDKEGNVSIDKTGKKSGRGAYITMDVDVAKQAKQKKTFNKVFEVNVDDQFYDELIAYTDHEQARKKLFENE